jgi:succinoglycan exporter
MLQRRCSVTNEPPSSGPGGDLPADDLPGGTAFPDDPVSLLELKQRTVSSVGVVLMQGVLLRSFAFLGLLVLARQLTPEDFGAVAFGLSITTVGRLLADGGLGAALLRRPAPPTTRELRSLLGFQLLLSVVLATAVGLTAPLAGEAGVICAIMVWTLPLAALKVPGSLLLERQMKFGLRVRVEVVETFVYYAWAISAVSMGFGVIGLATGTLAGSLAGVIVIALISPVGVPLPMLSLTAIRPLLGFGFQFQGVAAVNLVRDQGLNFLVVSLAGIEALGLWSMAYRFLSIPFLLFDALWRVSIPATSMLIRSGAEVAERIRRVLISASVATGLLLTPFAVTAPAAIFLLLGPKWEATGAVIAPACLGLLINGPASVAASAYTYASGNAGLVLRAAIAHTLAWFAVTAALLPAWGVGAVGAGWLAAGLVDVGFFSRALSVLGIKMFRMVWPSYVAGAVGYLVGFAILEASERGWIAVIASGLGSATSYLVVELAIRRTAVHETAQFLRLAVSRAG